MTEELYINGEAVDLKPDAATTLNYKSNLLGDSMPEDNTQPKDIRQSGGARLCIR